MRKKLKAKGTPRRWRVEEMDQVEAMGGGNKKMKMDTLDFRLQSRISYGADNVVGKCVAISSTSRFCALSTSATTTMMKTGEHAD